MFETRALEHSLHKTSFHLIGWQYDTHITLCGDLKWMDAQSLVCSHVATAKVTLSFGQSGSYIVDEDVEIVPNTRKKGKCQITTKVFTSLKSLRCFSSASHCGVSIFVAAVHCSGWNVMLCKDWVSSESGLKALESLEHELPSPVSQIIFICFFSKRFQCFNMTKWFQLLQFKSAKFHMQVPLGGTAPTSASEPSVSIYQPVSLIYFQENASLLRFFSPPWWPACFLDNTTGTFVSVTLCRWLFCCKDPSVWCELRGPRGRPRWRSWTPGMLISMLRSNCSSKHLQRPIEQQLSRPVSCPPCLCLCCVSVLICVCLCVHRDSTRSAGPSSEGGLETKRGPGHDDHLHLLLLFQVKQQPLGSNTDSVRLASDGKYRVKKTFLVDECTQPVRGKLLSDIK